MAERIVKKVVIEVDDKGSLKRTNKDSQTLNRNMKGLSQQSSNASKNFSKQAQGMQGILVPAYAEVAARVFALTAAYQALSRASDFRILMQGQAEYAKRTGKNMGDISKQVQKASKGMLSFADASSAVALASTSGISSGQITRMTKLAVDSSTALGRSVTDTMDRLTRGIVKAEPEILDEIGVIIRLDKVYKDYAESVSKSTQELSEGEKAHARFTAITNQLEQKFGGIADNIDPNYMRAAAATVMDVVMQISSAASKIFDPILKFLSESKSTIVVILAVIMKTLAGKVLPVFGGFGKAIAEVPKRMSKNVQDLDARIKAMNKSIAVSRTMATNLNAGINKALPAQWRGAAFKTAGSGVGGQVTKLRSMNATIARATREMGTGTKITSGKYAGMTRNDLVKLRQDYAALRVEVGKTHSQMEVGYNKAKLVGLQFNKVLKQTSLAFTEAAKSAAIYFTRTKRLIADKGFISGTVIAVKLLTRQWQMASAAATLYGRTIQKVAVVTAAFGAIAAAAATAVNAIFGIIMWLTLIVSLGKMILDLFVDFDTPFKRAADAAKTLNDELKEQETLLSQKHAGINFEGAAASFDEAMSNATFADNFATSLYESTSKAMKSLSAEMGEMGFWEGAFDWIKDLFGMGSLDYQKKAIQREISLTGQGPNGANILSELATKYGMTGTSRVDNFDKMYQSYLAGNYEEKGSLGLLQNAAGLLGIKIKDGFTKKQFETVEGTMRPQTIMDLFNDKDFKKLDSEKQTAKLLEIFTDLNEAQKKVAETAKAAKENLVEMTDAFDSLSKNQKKFTDKLLIKTSVHDMAVDQKKLQAIFAKEGVSNATKLLALQDRGMIPDKFKKLDAYTSLLAAQKDGDQDATKLAAANMYSALGKEVNSILGDLQDWVKIDDTLTSNVTSRLTAEREIMFLNKFASKTGRDDIMRKEALLAERKINEAQTVYDTMQFQNEAAAAQGNKPVYSLNKMGQAKANIDKMKQERRLKIGYAQNAYSLSQAELGRKGTISGRYEAIRDDLGDMSPMEDLALDAEMAHEYKKAAADFVNSIGQGAGDIKAHLTNIHDILDRTGGMNDFLDTLRQQGYGKYLDLSESNQNNLIRYFAGSKEDKAIPAKIKAATLEIKKLQLEERYRTDSKEVLNFRQKVAEIELNVVDKGNALIQKQLALAVAIEKAELRVRNEQIEEDLGWLKDSIKSIGDAFGNAIKQGLNDVFMNRGFSMDKFRNTMAQGFAGAASNNIGNMAQKAVFGNQGFLASALRGTALEPFVDDLFPKTQLEVAQASLEVLKEIRDGKGGIGAMMAGPFSYLQNEGSSNQNTAKGALALFFENLFGKLFGGATGGYAKGGFRAFANGGMVNRPTLGLLGEGRYNEAVVPLPDGRSIPVTGSTGDVTVNVSIDSDGGSQVEVDGGESAKRLGFMVSQAVQSEIVQQQRPGGLLNSYG